MALLGIALRYLNLLFLVEEFNSRLAMDVSGRCSGPVVKAGIVR